MLTLPVQEYPVSFAETKEQAQDTPFYIEWLDNSSEFPGLAATSTTLGKENWELLRRKDTQDERYHQIEEIDDWAKIAAQPQLYADITQKNATDQPKVRTVQPLWPHSQKEHRKPKIEDDDEGALDELFYEYKSHSRRSNQLARRRQKHDMETVRLNMEVVFRLVTSKNGTVNISMSSQDLDTSQSPLLSSLQERDLKEFRINNRAQALSFIAKYKHNTKKYNAVYAGISPKQPKQTNVHDESDLPVVRK